MKICPLTYVLIILYIINILVLYYVLQHYAVKHKRDYGMKYNVLFLTACIIYSVYVSQTSCHFSSVRLDIISSVLMVVLILILFFFVEIETVEHFLRHVYWVTINEPETKTKNPAKKKHKKSS
jgi:ABC-type xylose transport system permease subunit